MKPHYMVDHHLNRKDHIKVISGASGLGEKHTSTVTTFNSFKEAWCQQAFVINAA